MSNAKDIRALREQKEETRKKFRAALSRERYNGGEVPEKDWIEALKTVGMWEGEGMRL
jgi:hypothetical protein